MTIEIREVTTRQDLKAFIKFPYHLYKGNPYWVPAQVSSEIKTLSKDSNAAFEHSQARYWLAYRDGQIAGRVAAIFSEGHRQRWNQAYMRFGWIDFIDDHQVSSALLGKVEEWAHEKGCTAVHGPLGFSDMDKAGMLVEGFEELGTLATLYNYSYYPRHLEGLGYSKDTDWVEYEITPPQELDERISRLAQIVLERNYLHMLRYTRREELLPYAPKIFSLINEGYRNLYGFVHLNERQIAAYTKQYFSFILPDFVPVVLDAQDNVVAFGISMPSLSRAMQKADGRLFPFGFIHLLRALRKNERADLYLIVVKPDYQGKGVNALMISQIAEVFRRFGIRKVESNPELEDNFNVQSQWKNFEKRQHKRRRSYIKHLG